MKMIPKTNDYSIFFKKYTIDVNGDVIYIPAIYTSSSDVVPSIESLLEVEVVIDYSGEGTRYVGMETYANGYNFWAKGHLNNGRENIQTFGDFMIIADTAEELSKDTAPQLHI